MSGLWTFLADNAGPLGLILAFIAAVASLLALRRPGPQISVALSKSLILGSPDSKWDGRSVVFVNVTNDGSLPVKVQAVSLESGAGSLRCELLKEGARSATIDAQGGSVSWVVDRDDLRRIARRGDDRDRPVEFRAVVRSGTRTYRSKAVERVHPREPAMTAGVKRTGRDRICHLWDDWLKPRPGCLAVDCIDLEHGKVQIPVNNFGGWVVRGAMLELTEEIDGEQRRLLPPIAIPPIWRHRAAYVDVPAADRDGLTWVLRHRGRRVGSSTAMTRSRLEGILTEYRRESEIDGNPSHDADKG